MGDTALLRRHLVFHRNTGKMKSNLTLRNNCRSCRTVVSSNCSVVNTRSAAEQWDILPDQPYREPRKLSLRNWVCSSIIQPAQLQTSYLLTTNSCELLDGREIVNGKSVVLLVVVPVQLDGLNYLGAGCGIVEISGWGLR